MSGNENEDDTSTTTHGSLRDKVGTVYRVTYTREGWLREWVVFQGVWIGRASRHVRDGVMTVGDLHFRKDLVRAQSWWQRLLRHPQEKVDFRRSGLGSALLPPIIDRARRDGCHRIEGIVSIFDLEDYPGLPDWYRRFGFTYTAETPGTRIAGHLALVLA